MALTGDKKINMSQCLKYVTQKDWCCKANTQQSQSVVKSEWMGKIKCVDA